MTSRILLIAIFALTLTGYSQHPSPSVASAIPVGAPAIKTYQLDSKLMARSMPYTVILPANYETEKEIRFPVIYLLHGLGGDHKVTKLSSAKYTDQQRVIMVFVEGGKGFYTDSATKRNDKYESYVLSELIPEVDKNLRTIADRKGRAIAGVSMGGYGALKYGIKYPHLFYSPFPGAVL